MAFKAPVVYSTGFYTLPAPMGHGLTVNGPLTVNGKRVLTTDDWPAPEPIAPSLMALAATAATAAAVSTPISRRRLLRFWRG